MKNKITEFTFKSAEGCDIYAWKSEVKDARAVLQIVHGMSDHKDRYRGFADFCASEKINIYIHDHLGHGQSAGGEENIGFLPAKNGWQKMKDDIHGLSEIVRSEQNGLPHFLMGHSMGSFLVRSLLMSGYCDYQGILLTGNPDNPGLLRISGIFLAKIINLVKGHNFRTRFLHNMIYGSNNKAFQPARTEFDWLSRDPEIGEKFAADPYCGKIFSSGYYFQLGLGAKNLFSALQQSFVPVDLPFFILSGEMDPVGSGKKGCIQAYKTYKRAGISDVSMKIYPEARHEILNETNKNEVSADICSWIHEHGGQTG